MYHKLCYFGDVGSQAAWKRGGAGENGEKNKKKKKTIKIDVSRVRGGARGVCIQGQGTLSS